MCVSKCLCVFNCSDCSVHDAMILCSCGRKVVLSTLCGPVRMAIVRIPFPILEKRSYCFPHTHSARTAHDSNVVWATCDDHPRKFTLVVPVCLPRVGMRWRVASAGGSQARADATRASVRWKPRARILHLLVALWIVAGDTFARVPACGRRGRHWQIRLSSEAPGPPSQLPGLATDRAAVTNGYSHRMFC